MKQARQIQKSYLLCKSIFSIADKMRYQIKHYWSKDCTTLRKNKTTKNAFHIQENLECLYPSCLKKMEESFACHYYSTKTGLGLPSEPKSLVDRFPLGFGNTFCAKFSFGSKFWSGPFGNLVAVSGSKHFFL